MVYYVLPWFQWKKNKTNKRKEHLVFFWDLILDFFHIWTDQIDPAIFLGNLFICICFGWPRIGQRFTPDWPGLPRIAPGSISDQPGLTPGVPEREKWAASDVSSANETFQQSLFVFPSPPIIGVFFYRARGIIFFVFVQNSLWKCVGWTAHDYYLIFQFYNLSNLVKFRVENLFKFNLPLEGSEWE